jgi:hypothetical protein
LDDLQKGLAKKPAALPIQILGVNEAGQEEGNADFVDGRSLPLLQDTEKVDVWSSWGVAYRDVVIVSPSGEKVGVYNLTEHDLGDAANFAAFEAKLRAAADAK